MTPQQRAEAVVNAWCGENLIRDPHETTASLTEAIRRAIVAATNDELERRRRAEAERDAVQAAMQRLIHGGAV